MIFTYDEGAYNVVGTRKGTGNVPSMMLNAFKFLKKHVPELPYDLKVMSIMSRHGIKIQVEPGSITEII